MESAHGPGGRAALAALATLLTLAACGGGVAAQELRADTSRTEVAVGSAVALPEAVRASDRLGLELLAVGEEPNAVVSPASAAVALAMLAEGARGTTAAELDALLGASGTERTDAYNALTAQLLPLAGDPSVVQDDTLPEMPVVHLANNVVLDDEAQVREEYLEALAAGFGAGIQTTDLGSADGKRALDAWVRDNTGGLIESSAVRPDPALRLVLQNAVVLAAPWMVPFDPAATAPMPFTLGNGTTVEVPAMATMTATGYATVEGWQAVRLLYAGGGLHADVLLPPPGERPQALTPELVERLTTALADDARSRAPREVELRLPRIDLRTQTSLLPVLAARAASLTDPAAADLSGVSTAEALVLSGAEQQATLSVFEAGTVAAAVTELSFATGLPLDVVRLDVDRPYVFRVAEARTEWTLFLARVGDPRG